MAVTRTQGSKYTGRRDVADVAKDVRKDLKKAQKTGDLPAQAKFSVRIRRASMMQEIVVRISGMPARDMYFRVGSDEYGYDQMTTAATALVEKVRGFVEAYNRSAVEWESDYCNVDFFTEVTLAREPVGTT